MTTRERIMVIAWLWWLSTPTAACANPLPPPPSVTGGLSLFAVPLLLPMEGLVIATLAQRANVRWASFVFAWTGVTALTLVLMMSLIALLSGIVGPLVAGMVGEATVVAAEAWCIVAMLGSDRFAANPIERPGPSRAVVYSAIANLASLVGGAVLLALV